MTGYILTLNKYGKVVKKRVSDKEIEGMDLFHKEYQDFLKRYGNVDDATFYKDMFYRAMNLLKKYQHQYD